MNVSEKIRQAMRSFRPKLTQLKLSELSGVPQPTISRALKGKTVPEFDTLSKLSKVLKIEIDRFDLTPSEGVGSEKKNDSPAPYVLSKDEEKLLEAYRKQPSEHLRAAALTTLLAKVNDPPKKRAYIPPAPKKGKESSHSKAA